MIAPPPVGQQAAISGHMATLSLKNQKKIIWDDSDKQGALRVGAGGTSAVAGMLCAADSLYGALPLLLRCSSRRGSSRWIIGRGVDLTLVIGSAVAGYGYLLLYGAFHVPISWLWWFWSVGFDGTHIFATASRTFFDSEARGTESQAAVREPGGLFFAWGRRWCWPG